MFTFHLLAAFSPARKWPHLNLLWLVKVWIGVHQSDTPSSAQSVKSFFSEAQNIPKIFMRERYWILVLKITCDKIAICSES